MRVVFSGLVVILAASTSAIACTCVNDPLAKRFRKAEAIFVGTLAYEELYEKPEKVQNYKDGLWVLLVKESFKGVRKEYVAIDLDMTHFSGACPSLTRLDDDRDYLIFAYGKDLKVRAECSDSRELKAEYNETTREISKLDSFWFRTRARLWPF